MMCTAVWKMIPQKSFQSSAMTVNCQMWTRFSLLQLWVDWLAVMEGMSWEGLSAPLQAPAFSDSKNQEGGINLLHKLSFLEIWPKIAFFLFCLSYILLQGFEYQFYCCHSWYCLASHSRSDILHSPVLLGNMLLFIYCGRWQWGVLNCYSHSDHKQWYKELHILFSLHSSLPPSHALFPLS